MGFWGNNCFFFCFRCFWYNRGIKEYPFGMTCTGKKEVLSSFRTPFVINILVTRQILMCLGSLKSKHEKSFTRPQLPSRLPSSQPLDSQRVQRLLPPMSAVNHAPGPKLGVVAEVATEKQLIKLFVVFFRGNKQPTSTLWEGLVLLKYQTT